MELNITDKHKKALFTYLFQTLKHCTNTVNVHFNSNHIHIQGLDASHICMFNVNIQQSWFDTYTVLNPAHISFDTHTFHTIISSCQDSNNIYIRYDETIDSDYLHIDLLSPVNSNASIREFNKYFKLPLSDYEYEYMNTPKIEYDAEFAINSKSICEIISQMMIFGSDINVKCSEEQIHLITNGITGDMMVNIPIDDLSAYSVVEGDIIDLKYSLSSIHKMCLTNKLSSEIMFYISNDYPMKIEYDLGNNSNLVFYVAPKISD
jgi:proliferating cell nuclear antigen PCNA